MELSLDFDPFFHRNKCSRGMHARNDHFSSLPVELLLIILSFLPLKQMVKTSILSRRWLNLWVKTPVLNFHYHSHVYSDMIRKRLVNWVNHVIQQHKGRYLKEFRIRFNVKNDYREDIERWLEFALARKVEILELNFLFSGDSMCRDNNYRFADCWFSNGNLKLLKSLSLKNVNVTDEAVNFFLQNCPFLERLELVGNDLLVNLVITDPTLVLKYLQIRQCFELKVLSISNFNLVSLDTCNKDVILQHLPMLVELSTLGDVDTLRHILSRNATCLRQLECLELYLFELKDVTELMSNLAEMTKLKRLVVKYIIELDESLIGLLFVIKSCNRLEEFVLELNWYQPDRLSREMSKIERLSFESLKHFEFKGYYGRASDLELVMNVAKNAPGLEKIIIDISHLTRRRLNRPDDSNELEDRKGLAIKHMKDLRETKFIAPHVTVLVRG